MNSQSALPRSGSSRLGFHYYNDSLHYREKDLATWLPELQAMGAGWLVLQSTTSRAIPETFLQGLIKGGIEPVIQINLSLGSPPGPGELSAVLDAYAHWGVRCVQFFDRPNSRSAWPAAGWAQEDLVERFLDRWIPLANAAQKNGLLPFFPALEPGGNFWDTAFLRAALQSLERRKQSLLLQEMVLSAYAWTGGHSLNWGAGGPEAWPETRPYLTPSGSQDQRGFHAADWYLTIAQAAVQKNFPVFLFQAGIPADPLLLPVSGFEPGLQRDTALAIAQLLADETACDPQNQQVELESLPAQVFGCAFWLLADSPDSPYAEQAWINENGEHLPAVDALKSWREGVRSGRPKWMPKVSGSFVRHPIKHYLLLPSYEWGIADWHLEVIRPFIKKYCPTTGFSLEEAALAEKVTVIGNLISFPEEVLEQLRACGCSVERISGDGTSIATQLAER